MHTSMSNIPTNIIVSRGKVHHSGLEFDLLRSVIARQRNKLLLLHKALSGLRLGALNYAGSCSGYSRHLPECQLGCVGLSMGFPGGCRAMTHYQNGKNK